MSQFAKTCWNCGSSNFEETVSHEYCPDCGIGCDYHGNGANEAYERANIAKHEKEEMNREEY